MHYYCTYFDKNYLFKGLALYYSLLDHDDDFNLHILCLDDEAHAILNSLNLTKASLTRLADFEDENPELKEIKKTRSLVEYFWTLSPSWPLHLLNKHPEIDVITYLDSDLLFFSSPQPIFDEFADNDILIIGHKYSEKFKICEASYGTYNVGFLSFRNNENGKACLKWWQNKCNEWCYYTTEDGKMGDQYYLNEWPKLFKNVCDLKNIGANVAIWNMANYEFKKNDDAVLVDNQPLIFFHFNQFSIYKLIGNVYYYLFTNLYYKVSHEFRKMIYDHYFSYIKKAIFEVNKIKPGFDRGVKNNRNYVYFKSKEKIKHSFPFLTPYYLSLKKLFTK